MIFSSREQNLAASDFGYLSERNTYLDSACQTLRPQPVIDAVNEYWQQYNACGGRVKYDWGRKVDQAVADTRESLLKLTGRSTKDYVCAFTLNTTYGINLFLSQLPSSAYKSIVSSEIEHNSVLLPALTYSKKHGWRRLLLARQEDGSLKYEPGQLDKAVVVVNTTSNIDGRKLANAKQLTDDAHRRGGIVILDGAQTMGQDSGWIKNIDFDALCFSGHKMYGPSLGVIIVKRSLLESLELSFIGGGTVEDVGFDGYRLVSEDIENRLEAGLQDFAGIIGLGKAVVWKQKQDYNRVDELAERLYTSLQRLPSLTILNHQSSPVASFYFDSIDSHKLAVYLSAQGIMARSGYFCCHYYLSSVKKYPPLLRLSLGLNNTAEQVDQTVETIKKIIEGVK